MNMKFLLFLVEHRKCIYQVILGDLGIRTRLRDHVDELLELKGLLSVRKRRDLNSIERVEMLLLC
jgi:hypothetical protein